MIMYALIINYFVSDVLLDGLPDGEGGGGRGGVEGGEEAGEQLRPWGELRGDPGAHGLTICELRPHEEICWDPLDWSFANCAHEENFVETQAHMDHLLSASTHRNSLRPRNTWTDRLFNVPMKSNSWRPRSTWTNHLLSAREELHWDTGAYTDWPSASPINTFRTQLFEEDIYRGYLQRVSSTFVLTCAMPTTC